MLVSQDVGVAVGLVGRLKTVLAAPIKSHTIITVRITWDGPKRAASLANRGLDFATLDIAFFEGAVVVPAKQGRFMAIGRFRGSVLAVIFAPLGIEAVSVISMRRASRKERSIL